MCWCNVTMPSASLLAIPHLMYKREASMYKNRPCVGQSTTPKNSDVMLDHVIHILFINVTVSVKTSLVRTSFRSGVEFQADNAQLVRSTGANMSVMALQGCKTSPQKSRPLESGHRRHGVWVAIEYSYVLGQKN